MKLTVRQLKKVISEAIQHREFGASEPFEMKAKLVSERRHGSGGPLYDADASFLLEFARAYAGLGNAVQEQLETILNGNTEDFDGGTNSNAIKLIEDRMGGMNEEIDTAISAYNDWYENGAGGPDPEADEDEEDDGSMAYAARVNRL